ncbi:MAG: class I SAM-dependent methyltransferase [Candidatus Tectomicrobia bacterium]|uniref:Class I SAM-dependent methyltransferase n=1 Tax=Tectimicrobiota bacterium TaxID=2528274 RepID=A0A932I256_UNCTE|nr:class I SAM-dependent methyltransferase [Candidatus Tectomicrobia bacterium]
MRTLDVGCGRAKAPGAVGLDLNPAADADVRGDASRDGLPFREGAFGRVVIRHIIEHVESPLRLLEEIHRVSRDGAEVEGVTPHFSNPCSFADPTHRHHFSVQLFGFVSEGGPDPSKGWRLWANRLLECYYEMLPFYTKARFEVLERRLTFCRLHRWLGVAWLANRFPEIYEFHLSGLFRARDIVFRLRVRKG